MELKQLSGVANFAHVKELSYFIPMSDSNFPKKSPHAINLRMSIPWFFGRRYFVFLAGKDRRGTNQELSIHEQRQNTPVGWAFLAGTLLLWAIFTSSIVSIVVLYLLKTWAGIDLIEGASPIQSILHSLKICHNIKS